MRLKQSKRTKIPVWKGYIIIWNISYIFESFLRHVPLDFGKLQRGDRSLCGAVPERVRFLGKNTVWARITKNGQKSAKNEGFGMLIVLTSKYRIKMTMVLKFSEKLRIWENSIHKFYPKMFSSNQIAGFLYHQHLWKEIYQCFRSFAKRYSPWKGAMCDSYFWFNAVMRPVSAFF